jgi:hypothetical protein
MSNKPVNQNAAPIKANQSLANASMVNSTINNSSTFGGGSTVNVPKNKNFLSFTNLI